MTTSLLLLLLSILLVISGSAVLSASEVSSIQFNQAVDAAMYELAQDTTFQNYVSDHHPFIVPTCNAKTLYPSRSPIPFNVININVCTHTQDTFDDWSRLYRKVGNGLVGNLNKKYGLTLNATFLSVDTTVLGYFPSMKAAVDNGKCDIVVSDTTITAERGLVVKFAQCPYGFSSDGFLRTELDNNTITGIDSIAKLNRADVKVAYYGGTIYDTIVNQTLPLAQKFPATFDEQYQMVLQKRVHALIGDVVDLYNWKTQNTAACPSCFVKTFGDAAPFGIFTANTTRSNDGVSTVQFALGLVLMVASLFLIF